jgi:protein SCO1/2
VPRRATLLAAALTAVTALGVAGCSSSGHGKGDGASGQALAANQVQTPGAAVGQQMDSAMSPEIMNLPLVDESGRPTTLAAFKGQVLVISDSMTLCQETCPLDTANIVAAARSAGLGDKVRFLSITVDPQRDTPAQQSAYRALFAPPPPNWTLLTGSPATIAKLWKYFGVYIERVPEDKPPAHNWRTGAALTYDVDHSDDVFFIDGQQHWRFLLDGAPDVAPGTQLPATLRDFLSPSGLNNLKHPGAQPWTVPQVLATVGWLTNTRIPGASTAIVGG